MAEMREGLEKIELKIDETRGQMDTVRDAKFLPELYFMLADLYSKQSRFQYTIKVRENKGTPVEELDFTAELRPKYQAIQVYDTIVEKFPNIEFVDRAVFYKAHELRELGQAEEMIRTYQQLTRDYPKSKYWEEAQLIVGNFQFDNEKNVEKALKTYRTIVVRKRNPLTAKAYERMGWCYINLRKFDSALYAFEKVFKTYLDGSEGSISTDEIRQSDVRKDALLAMVWPYSEVPPRKLKKQKSGRHQVISYFKVLAPDVITYRKGLHKLGGRLTIKKRLIDATQVYFELLRLTTKLEDRIDVIERLYVSMKNTLKPWPVRGFVDEIISTSERVKYAGDLKDNERKKYLHDFEIYARDVATRAHKQAKQTGKPVDLEWAARDYETYLSFYGDSKHADKIRLNLAEAYYHLKMGTEAGRYYEELAKVVRSKKGLKDMQESAVESYILALKRTNKLTLLQRTQARYGLRSMGRAYIKSFPKSKIVPEVWFNVAQSYYDERRFKLAIKYLTGYIDNFPKGNKVSLAANLVLDVYNQQEDYDGLIKAGKQILANKSIADQSLKSGVAQIVQQAELKKIQVSTGGMKSDDYSKNLLKLASKYKDSKLGAQALHEAFLSLKSKRDPDMFNVGESLVVKYANTKFGKPTLTDMGQVALATADFKRAVVYFEIYADRYKSDSAANALLKNAAEMREFMGDYKLAARNYRRLGDWASVARMDFLSADWSSLSRTAENAPGVYGPYYQGVAQLKLRGPDAAADRFRQASGFSGGSYEEQEMVAHSLYLLAASDLNDYRRAGSGRGDVTAAVTQKVQLLNKMTESLNRVIATGNGKWIISAMYTQGQINREFASFLSKAPLPPGLSGSQKAMYKNEIAKQATQYAASAKQFFKQCNQSAEKYEIFSPFTVGCLSGGKKNVDEFQVGAGGWTGSTAAPKNALAIQKQLYDSPRNVGLLKKLSSVYMASRNFGLAQVVLNRALEIEPNDASLMSEMGLAFMFMDRPDDAKVWFKKAIKRNKNDVVALWGMAGLFHEYRMPKKKKQYLDRAKRAGRPTGVLPKAIKSLG